jgi:hypothetical protein
VWKGAHEVVLRALTVQSERSLLFDYKCQSTKMKIVFSS